MGSVAKVVTAPVKFVGEAISSVADFAMDAVLEPVVSMASGVVKGMTDDPFGTLIQIGAMASGNPFAIAAAAGANSARNGGSFLDIVAAAGTAYVLAPTSVDGVNTGSLLSNSLSLEAGSFTAKIANAAASAAARQIVNAAASGGDTAEAGQTAAVAAAVAAVANFAGGDGDDVLIGGSGNDTLSGEAEYLQSAAFADNFNLAKKTISEQLATAVEGYSSLPDAAKEVISGGAAAAVASSLSEGKAPSENEIAKVVAPAITTAETTIRAISNKDLSDNSAAQIARVVGDISRTAYEGANPYAARKVDVSEEFQGKINAAIDVVIESNDLDKAFTNISDSVSNFETAAQKANETALPVDAAADAVNKVIANATAMRNGEVEGFSSLEQWQDDNAAYEEGGRTDQGLRDRLVAWNTKYNDITAGEESLRAEYDKALEIHTGSLNNVDAAQDTLLTNQSNLDDVTKPFYKETSKAFTLALRPDFNEEEYRERYSIDPESDAYTHWLATGRSNLVNKQEYDQEISPFAGEDAVSLADNPSDVTDADIASGKARLERTSDGTYRFTNAPITISRFDPKYNKVVTTEFNSTENKYTVTGDNDETLETITENPDGSFTSTSVFEEVFPKSVAAMQEQIAKFNPNLKDLSRENPATAIDAASKLFKSVTTGSTGLDADNVQRQPFTLTSTLDPNSTAKQDAELLKVTKDLGGRDAYQALLNGVYKKYGSAEIVKETFAPLSTPDSTSDKTAMPNPLEGLDLFSEEYTTAFNKLPIAEQVLAWNAAGEKKSVLTPLLVPDADLANLVNFSQSAPADVPPPTNEEIKLQGGVEEYINRNYTDPAEAKEIFEGFGYTPTPEEEQRFVGRGLQTQTAEQVKAYVDPQQVTQEELEANLDYLKPDGRYDDYDGVDYDAIIKQFTGQGGEGFQEDQLAAARRYDEQFKQREASNPNSPDYSGYANDPGYDDLDAKLNEFFGSTGDKITPNDVDFMADLIAQQQAFDAKNPNSPNYSPPVLPETLAEMPTGVFYDPPPLGTTPPGVDAEIGGPDTPLPQGTTPPGVDAGSAGIPTKQPLYTLPDGTVIGGGDTPDDYTPDGYYKVGRSIYDVLTDPFDLNKDDRIDDADKTILEQVMDGTLSRTGLPEGNRFRSEGIEGELEETQRQIKEQEASRMQRETMQSQQALLQQLGATSPVQVKGPDPAKIDYVYDPFGESIFATQEQEQLFSNPYAPRKTTPQGIAGVLGGRRYG